ncbi:hypothetical protein K493DRAFT_296610 [Basidiobolus meristosporus CBS 931.73]|uniref:RGS domain-containing protein n=1 Tax=Basidiobolus meristosporus CBS 931.73 TaxID=1314790 RepID=A0A1Y1Z5J5_9FUNG|nr:hypothetical protein K493DRAFT_296610 [Basidiobolus meristosporus CBS 931.73]|eukprot:ORY05247.1 hypothetical protein K493DRAFT_296610 [Basidiobolus meristosporus CBS 931.73]
MVALCVGIDFFYRLLIRDSSPYLVLSQVLVALFIHFVSVCIPIFCSFKWTTHSPPSRLDYIQDKEDFCQRLLDWSFFEMFKQTATECLCVENVLFLEAYQDLKKLSLVAITNSESCTYTEHPESESKSGWSINSSQLPSNHALVSPATSNIVTCLSYPHASVKQCITPANISIARTVERLSEDVAVPSGLAPYYQRFYEKFFLPGSLLEVNIPCEIVTSLRDAINNNEYTLTMFDQAKEEVLDSLYYEVYLRFPISINQAT